MVLELKKSFVKEAEKIFNKLSNGYYVNLQELIDQIYYINSIVFCGNSITVLEPDSSDLCVFPTPPVTTSPACSFATGVARYVYAPAPTTIVPPVVLHCDYNGGYAEKVPYNCIYNGGYAVFTSV